MFTNFSKFDKINPLICKDEFCGFIDIDCNGQITYNEREDYSTLFVPSDQIHSYCNIHPSLYPIGDFVYVGLESPHKEEYKITPLPCFSSETMITCRPAIGSTGKYFNQKIVDKIGPHLGKLRLASLPVIKFNMVQIQCSLGKPTRFYRDENFIKALFDNSNNQHNKSLIQRLSQTTPGFFFNCCTKGDPATIRKALAALKHPCKDPELRNLVEPILTANLPAQTRYFKLNQHPSQWWK